MACFGLSGRSFSLTPKSTQQNSHSTLEREQYVVGENRLIFYSKMSQVGLEPTLVDTISE